MLTILLLVFVALLLIGVPIGFAMLGSSMLVIGLEGIPLSVVAQRVSTSAQSFPLLAVPLFTLAGALMNESGISERLFNFTRALVGHVRGGLAHTTIVGNVFLSGISGSSIADCAATSRIFVPQLSAAGYGRGFAAAVCSAAATLGPIIPPSILMVIYAWQANVSLGDLFMAGIIPGVVMAGAMMTAITVVTRRRNLPRDGEFSAARLGETFRRAIWALAMPVLILVGFRMGVFTATEIAAVACFYSLVVGLFIYRTIRVRDLGGILLTSARETSTILVIAAGAAPFGWILSVEQAPQQVANVLGMVSNEPWVILLVLNVALLVIGMFMETLALMIILVPILIPILAQLQIDLVHFGIVLLVNLVIGQITPPVGVLMFVASSVSQTSLQLITREIWPFVAALVVALLALTYIPALSLWLPAFLKG